MVIADPAAGEAARPRSSLRGATARDRAAYTVLDDKAKVVASGAIVVNSDGSYSFAVDLKRIGQARTFRITIADRDQAGNLATVTTTVTVSGIGKG